MAASGREPMKVVIINTKYVETDAKSFKSVVQELTGKDSRAVSSSTKPRSLFHKEQMISKRREEQGIDIEPAGVGTTPRGAVGTSFLMKNLSFKEFDRLLKEMPPVDDLLWNMD